MQYIFTVMWFAAVIAAAYWIERVWRRMLGRIFHAFLMPGILVSQLSRLGACLLVLAKVRKLRLFTSKGILELEHDPPKIPVVGNMAIALAPIVGCTAVLLLAAFLLEFPLWTFEMKADIKRLGGILGAPVATSVQVLNSIGLSGIFNLRTWVIIYLSICLGIAMRPSAKDFKEARWGILAIVGATLLFHVFCWGIDIPDYFLLTVQYPLGYLVAFLTMASLLTAIAELIAWLTRTAKGKPPAAGDVVETSAQPEPAPAEEPHSVSVEVEMADQGEDGPAPPPPAPPAAT